MDSRGGCCIARYATGGAYAMSKVQRIMLRFRPIAPKPSSGVGSTNSGSSSSESSDAFPKKGGRKKRKYSTSNNNTSKRCNNNNNNRRRKLSPESNNNDNKNNNSPVVVTLPLLPETPDHKNPPATTDHKKSGDNVSPAMWLSFESETVRFDKTAAFWCEESSNKLAAGEGSSVTVECVTDTCVDLEGLGGTDEERVMKLSEDTCPGFISDGYGRVTWTNGAFREMVGEGDEKGVRVRLAMKEEAGVAVRRAVINYPSFTCRVRVEYTCRNKKSSVTVPCDVWRLVSGGFAWRLDVKAALCL